MGARLPLAAGLLLGLGLGGLLDGILLHQILQWHNLASAAVPAGTLDGLRANLRLDGLFHAATWLLAAGGVAALWRAARRPHPPGAPGALAGPLLAAFGAFNLADGAVNHLVLGLHHVNETAPRPQWWAWDLGFLLAGALLLLAGLLLLRRGVDGPSKSP